MQIEEMNINDLIPYINNPRHNENAVDAVASSIKNFGFKVPIIIDKDNEVIAGHTRLKAAKKIGFETVPVIRAADLTPEQVKAFRLADNKVGELAEWDLELLDLELDELKNFDFDMSEFGFELDEDFKTTADKIKENPIDSSLLESFLIAPFSVLNTRQGDWQDRKRKWLETGIKSEIGRGENITFSKSLETDTLKGTSIFDPVLTELIYTWFSPDGRCEIIDPFAGGSVRGIVAKILGKEYTGIELRGEQVKANYENANELNISGVNWINDDSLNIDNHIEDETKDLFIACPPYFDLEVYSEDEKDISNMNFDDFTEVYSEIMTKAAMKLKNNRFAVIVISDVRDKKGFYRDLQGITKRALAQAGAFFYNDIVLVNVAGSGAIRARNTMKNRKVVRTHQNVLVFFKGNPKNIQHDFTPLKELENYLENYYLEDE